MLGRIEQVVQARKETAPSGSYVAGLLAKGQPAIARKIGEEASEVITAALGGQGDRRVIEEVADLWFHTIVLLGARAAAERSAQGASGGTRPARRPAADGGEGAPPLAADPGLAGALGGVSLARLRRTAHRRRRVSPDNGIPGADSRRRLEGRDQSKPISNCGTGTARLGWS